MRTALLITVALCAAQAAAGQDLPTTASRCGDTTVSSVAGETVHGIARLPRRASIPLLAAGAAAALGVHAADDAAHGGLSSRRTVHELFQPGAMIGSMPFEAGAAIATMAIGRIGHHPCAARVGADLLQAQLVGAAWTTGIKQVVRRSRPEGTGFSFPSGHTAAAFASATVLQQHFGWKVGLPAYAVASYVAASRVETGKHYWSDVAFAAALGIVAGRTMNIGGGHHLLVTPLAAGRGGGAALTLK